MATWQLLLAVWAIGIPGLLLAPALLPSRRSASATRPDDIEPRSTTTIVCTAAPRRSLRDSCIRPAIGSRQTRRAATP